MIGSSERMWDVPACPAIPITPLAGVVRGTNFDFHVIHRFVSTSTSFLPTFKQKVCRNAMPMGREGGICGICYLASAARAFRMAATVRSMSSSVWAVEMKPVS